MATISIKKLIINDTAAASHTSTEGWMTIKYAIGNEDNARAQHPKTEDRLFPKSTEGLRLSVSSNESGGSTHKIAIDNMLVVLISTI